MTVAKTPPPTLPITSKPTPTTPTKSSAAARLHGLAATLGARVDDIRSYGARQKKTGGEVWWVAPDEQSEIQIGWGATDASLAADVARKIRAAKSSTDLRGGTLRVVDTPWSALAGAAGRRLATHICETVTLPEGGVQPDDGADGAVEALAEWVADEITAGRADGASLRKAAGIARRLGRAGAGMAGGLADDLEAFATGGTPAGCAGYLRRRYAWSWS